MLRLRSAAAPSPTPAKSLVLCVAWQEGTHRRWKTLSADLKPLYADRKAMSDDESTIKALIICGLPADVQLAYVDKLDHKSKHDTEEIVRRRFTHQRALDKMRVLYSRVLDYCHPAPKAKPSKAALQQKAELEAAQQVDAAGGGGASSAAG